MKGIKDVKYVDKMWDLECTLIYKIGDWDLFGCIWTVGWKIQKRKNILKREGRWGYVEF